MKPGFVFKVIIHIDAVEDLTFYHYPRDELLADGKTPWRDFHWEFGYADGELLDDDFPPPPTRHCGDDRLAHWHRRDDDEDRDRESRRSNPRGILNRVSGCLDGGSRKRDQPHGRELESRWFRGESSRGRNRAVMNQIDQHKLTGVRGITPSKLEHYDGCHNSASRSALSDAIVISPMDHFPELTTSQTCNKKHNLVEGTHVIAISPTATFQA